MRESEVLITVLLTGLAAGGLVLAALVVALSQLSRTVRLVTFATGFSVAAWLITESAALGEVLGPGRFPLILLAWPTPGLFWVLVLTIFEDRPLTPLAFLPAAVFVATGPMLWLPWSPAVDIFWYGRNLFSALLAMHLLLVVVRGWRGDLVEGRRRFRALLVGVACVFVVAMVAAGFAYRADPQGPWIIITAGRAGGAGFMAVFALLFGLLVMQVRPSAFGAPRQLEAGRDARAEAADRLLLERLDALMAAEAWRREGLTIGKLAGELGAPEHRLRRLINQRLGHRNFADFLNARRIDGAKRRLSNPAEARTTVAAIAFDLGYGSLGPFNRAFRAATGASPTEWRRQALADTWPELKEAV